jgi:hypothetical protein
MRGWPNRLQLAATLGLVLWLAGPIFAQETGPLPAAPPDQPATQPPPAQQPAAQSSPPQPAAAAPAPAPAPDPAAQPAASKTAPARVRIPSGTVLPLVLHNGISTRSAKIGDPVYFETLFPVMIDGHVAIPAGSYVSGEVTDSKRPGRVKGRAELMVRLNTLILPNAYMVNLNAVPSGAGTGGNETVDDEGKVVADSSKGADVGTIAKTTAAGAGIGGLATQSAKGAGIGAAVGAGVGLMAVLLTRGPEAELPRGSTVNVTLNRPLFLDAEKDQFATPGQSSTLAGPPNREPVRNSVPF